MAYENLCMYCFKDLGGETVCPHCGRDSRAAVPQIQMLPGTLVYHDRFLVGRALGQDANGIVYIAMDTKRGGTIRIREYLPRNCAERLNDGTVVPIAGMEDAFESGIRKLRSSVDSVEDPKKRHFFFEENGTAYIAQRKNASSGSSAGPAEEDFQEEEEADRRKQLILYIAIGAAIVLAVAIGLIWFLNSMGDPDDVTLQPLGSNSPGATWMPNQTPTPTPYATATFAALKDPELSWMDYTYPGNVDSEYQQQASASATRQPTVNTDTDYSTVNGDSSSSSIKKLQQQLAKLGWLSSSQVSGKYDSATRQAVKDFQTYVNENCSPAEKLAVDGIAGKKTQQWLYNSSVSLTKPTPTPKPLVTAAPDDKVINANSSAAEIRDVQKKLIFLGLMEKGSDDGRYGSGTTTAVKNFQIRVNQLQGYNVLEITGTVDELTMAYLNYYVDWWASQPKQTATPQPNVPTATPQPNVPTATPDSGTVNANSSRAQITAVQEQLEKVGLLNASDVDGVYGQRTISAVSAFQAWVNQTKGEQTLEVTGECDPLTRAYLDYCVENGRVVDILPTDRPTQQPTQQPDPTEVPPNDQAGPNGVGPESPVESITFVQEMLSDIGLLDSDSIDGNYGENTKAAIRALQEFVNAQKGEQVLEVTGLCDSETLEYLMYCYDQGWNVGDQGDVTDPDLSEPTQEPEEIDPTEPPATQVPEDNYLVGPDSSTESIRRLQDLLNGVGLLSSENIDGNYSEATMQAVRELQQAVNDYNGKQVLAVTGYCDNETMRYLEYSYDKGMNLGDHGDEPDVDEPTQEPTQEPVGTIDSFTVSLSGQEIDGGRIELEPGRYDFSWQATGQVQSYFLYLYDGSQTLLQSTENTDRTGFKLDTSKMSSGETYELRIGALPVNGTQEDIKWRSVQLVLAQQATAEPTNTPAPSVSKPTINIGSSVYQSNGVTYINDSTIIFGWTAEGDVESYTVNLVYEDGTSYSLGTTTDTSKTVSASQLKPGLYKLYVGATPIGGDEDNTIWAELLFGVPEPEATEEPSPTQSPEDPDGSGTQISYIDVNSLPEDIQIVQMALYQRGLLNTDTIEPGVLDQGTLEAVAAFQEMANADLDAGLTVIDPTVDQFIDEATLKLLLAQP